MRSSPAHLALLKTASLTAFVLFAACRPAPTDKSDPLVARDAITDITNPAPVTAFINAAKALANSAEHGGLMSTELFVAMMPLSGADRQKLENAYPNGFEITCNGAICRAVTSGASTQTTLLAAVKLSFFVTISEPTLTLANQVKTDFVLRGNTGIEFCNVQGMSVTKIGIVKTIYGFYERIANGAAKLTVGDEPGDYTCAL